MFNRDWLSGAAVGIVATYLFALVPQLMESRPTPPNELASRQYDRDAREAMEWSAAVKQEGKPAVTCGQGDNNPNCSEQYSAALDLSAQWATAQATRDIRWLTEAQLLIGIVGLFALAYTLYLTRESVRAANRTADETKLSSERQLRAYVSIKSIKMERDGNGYFVDVKYVNTGQTPAYKIKVSHAWVTSTAPVFEDLDTEKSGSSRDLGPGMNFTIRIPVRFKSPAHEDAAIQRKTPFYAWGHLTYVDAFKHKRHLKFRVTLPTPFISDPLMLVACADGNESN